MNKFKKIGLTALAGSLVATSAFAGELTASGSASIGVSNITGTADTSTGKNWSMGNSVNFAGSGELDNGWSVSTFVLQNDGSTGLSSSAATMTMGDLGTVGVSKGGGFNVNGGYDETYPRAYEENSDAGGQSSLYSV